MQCYLSFDISKKQEQLHHTQPTQPPPSFQLFSAVKLRFFSLISYSLTPEHKQLWTFTIELLSIYAIEISDTQPYLRISSVTVQVWQSLTVIKALSQPNSWAISPVWLEFSSWLSRFTTHGDSASGVSKFPSESELWREQEKKKQNFIHQKETRQTSSSIDVSTFKLFTSFVFAISTLFILLHALMSFYICHTLFICHACLKWYFNSVSYTYSSVDNKADLTWET